MRPFTSPALVAVLLLTALPLSALASHQILLPCGPLSGLHPEADARTGCNTPNLLQNPGFETCTGCSPEAGALPDGWTYSFFYDASEGEPVGNASWTHVGAREGTAALRLHAGETQYVYHILESARVPVEAGSSYSASVWVRLDAPEGTTGSMGFLQVLFWDAAGRPLRGDFERVPVEPGWTRSGLVQAAPEGATEAALELSLGHETHAILVDATLLQKGGTLNPWTLIDG
ncbi:MAG TPA: hypothetical protein VNZ52_12390 [Candidatus Thermoplasmatota archaeon]|nr:hypothetical protein [Candidatus Thermoplasmatota archaeon]